MSRFRSHGFSHFMAFGLCLFFTAQAAKAVPISFTESFTDTGSLPGPFLEQSAGGTAATFNGSEAVFPGNLYPGRSYLRTIGTDYSAHSFTADVTVNILSNGGNGTVFFGMGVGEPYAGFFNEPSTVSQIYLRASPDNFSAGGIYISDNNLTGANNGLGHWYGGDPAGTGTHRLRMSWNAALQEMTLAIHQDYTGGPFSASSTFGAFDGSDNGFNATNSHIFFGGTSGTTFDDLSVTVVPEPSSVILLLGGAVALFGYRRKRRG